VVGGRRAESVAAQLVSLHQGQEDLMVVGRWSCIRLHSLGTRVSATFLCAPKGIGPYQELKTIALEYLWHAQAAGNPWSAEAWR
jgi:hypothetical protein